MALGAGALLAGCGGGDDDEPSAKEGAKLYFTAGEQFEPIDADSPDVGPGEAVKQLLDGPAKRRRAGDVPVETNIPEGASLEDLTVEDDGKAVVKLSPEFGEGVPDDPAQRTLDQQADFDARVAQVTYTLTQFKEVEDAKVVSGNKVVERSVDRKELAAPAGGPKPVARPAGPAPTITTSHCDGD